MPKAKAKRNVRAVTGAQSDQATMVVTLYDGTREPIHDKEFLIRIFDGFQNQLFDDFKPAPTTLFRLPFRDNLQDNCRVLASGDGHVDAGFTPVKLSPQAVAGVDLMFPDVGEAEGDVELFRAVCALLVKAMCPISNAP